MALGIKRIGSKMLLVDSSVWMDHFGDAKKKSSACIENEGILACSILTLFEVERRLIKMNIPKEKIDQVIQFMKTRAIIVNLNENIVHKGVEVGIRYKLGTVDALMYASAQEEKMKLITGDYDFHGLPEVEIIGKDGSCNALIVPVQFF